MDTRRSCNRRLADALHGHLLQSTDEVLKKNLGHLAESMTRHLSLPIVNLVRSRLGQTPCPGQRLEPKTTDLSTGTDREIEAIYTA